MTHKCGFHLGVQEDPVEVGRAQGVEVAWVGIPHAGMLKVGVVSLQPVEFHDIGEGSDEDFRILVSEVLVVDVAPCP